MKNKEKEILDILKRAPFILERLFENNDMTFDYNHRYMFGTITIEEVAKVRDYFDK